MDEQEEAWLLEAVWIHVYQPRFAFTFDKCWDSRYKTWKRKLRGNAKLKAETQSFLS